MFHAKCWYLPFMDQQRVLYTHTHICIDILVFWAEGCICQDSEVPVNGHSRQVRVCNLTRGYKLRTFVCGTSKKHKLHSSECTTKSTIVSGMSKIYRHCTLRKKMIRNKYTILKHSKHSHKDLFTFVYLWCKYSINININLTKFKITIVWKFGNVEIMRF